MGQISTISADEELPELFQRIAERQNEKLVFQETRISELLLEPVIISGSLHRAEDGRLIREIQKPRPETQILFSDHVEITRPGGYFRRFSLDRAPELQALRYALDAILSGKLEQLQSQFKLELQTVEMQWQLCMLPLAEHIANSVDKLILVGHDDQIQAIELYLHDAHVIRTEIHEPGKN